MTGKIWLLENLKKRKLPPKAEVNFLTFISLYKSFRDITFNYKFEKAIHQINFKKETMSNLELYAAVKAEEMKEGIVRKLLIKTKHSLEEIADLASISLSDVKLIKSRLATS